MKLSIALITIASIVFFILPIVYLTRRGKKREKRFLQELSNMAFQNNCTISEQEYFGHTAIGVDKKSHMLFFTRKTPGNDILNEVNLSEIQRCQIINTRHSVSPKKDSHSITERIILALTYRDKNKSEINLEIYNVDFDNLIMSGEMQIAEKWSRIINENIPKVK